jgi:purine-binding chemotaxis protein CheW
VNSFSEKSAGPHYRPGPGSEIRPNRRRPGFRSDSDPYQDDIIQLIGFGVGHTNYGADIMSVREILRDPVIETCEEAPSFIRGTTRVRSEIIPLIDLKKRLGCADQKKPSPKSWVLVVRARNCSAGFIVDSVSRIIKIRPDHILPAPDLILEGLGSPYLRGVCTADKELFVVLDFEQMLSIDEARALENMAVQPRP